MENSNISSSNDNAHPKEEDKLFWMVYYSDGEPVSSEECTPFEIERRVDVQVIAQENKEHRWVTRSGHDFYVWDDRGGGEQWFNATYSGMIQYLMHPGQRCVLFGYEIDKRKFHKIFNEARSKFGYKDSYERNERQPD